MDFVAARASVFHNYILFYFQLCGDYLIDNLSVQNACECMQAAVAYSQQDLRDHALRYIEEHTEVRIILFDRILEITLINR